MSKFRELALRELLYGILRDGKVDDDEREALKVIYPLLKFSKSEYLEIYAEVYKDIKKNGGEDKPFNRCEFIMWLEAEMSGEYSAAHVKKAIDHIQGLLLGKEEPEIEEEGDREEVSSEPQAASSVQVVEQPQEKVEKKPSQAAPESANQTKPAIDNNVAPKNSEKQAPRPIAKHQAESKPEREMEAGVFEKLKEVKDFYNAAYMSLQTMPRKLPKESEKFIKNKIEHVLPTCLFLSILTVILVNLKLQMITSTGLASLGILGLISMIMSFIGHRRVNSILYLLKAGKAVKLKFKSCKVGKQYADGTCSWEVTYIVPGTKMGQPEYNLIYRTDEIVFTDEIGEKERVMGLPALQNTQNARELILYSDICQELSLKEFGQWGEVDCPAWIQALWFIVYLFLGTFFLLTWSRFPLLAGALIFGGAFYFITSYLGKPPWKRKAFIAERVPMVKKVPKPAVTEKAVEKSSEKEEASQEVAVKSEG